MVRITVSVPFRYLYLLICIGLLICVSSLKGRAAEPISYSVKFNGVNDGAVLSALKKVSNTVQLQERPPPTRNFLRIRAQKDLPRFREIMQSFSFYNAGGSVSVTKQKDSENFQVRFELVPGPVYTLEAINLETEPASVRDRVPVCVHQQKGLELGKPALADDIRRVSAQIRDQFEANGFALVSANEPVIHVDHNTRTLRITFRIRTGPRVTFGPLTIQGLETVDQSFITDQVPWQTGERYDPKLLSRFRKRLVESGLFSVIRIRHPESADKDSRLPFTVECSERKHRTIDLGISYNTNYGPGFTTGWEHRNLFGRNETLTIDADVSRILQELRVSFTKPLFPDPSQRLRINSAVYREDTDAYINSAARASVMLERTFLQPLTGGAGLGYKAARLEYADETDINRLLFFPTFLQYDIRDNILNPSTGTRIRLNVTPATILGSPYGHFTRLRLGISGYLTAVKSPKVVFALRTEAGMIPGTPPKDIPVDERFFAGGSGSVRGYEYQEIGPRVDDDPDGGTYLTEGSLEIRWNIIDQFGMAAFCDAGTLSGEFFFDRRIYAGAGGGLRYYTRAGPIRFDVAFPVNNDSHMDGGIQFYVSIGQAF